MLFETIKSIIKTLWGICRLKKGPEDLPNSPVVFAVIAIIAVLLSGAFAILLMMLFVWLVLKYKHLESRFIQTASALFGTTSILSLLVWVIALPLESLFLVIYGPLSANAAFPTYAALLILISLMILGLTFLIWIWAIAAHIYSRAMNKSFSFGILIALAGFLFIVAIQMILGGLFTVGVTGFLYGSSNLLHHPFMLSH